MNTTIVGRVAVRVLPETSGFKEDLEAKLKKETAGVDAEVPVDANLDADELERQLRAKVEELKNKFVVRLRSQIQDLKKQVANLTKQAEAQSKADPITFESEVDNTAAKLAGGKIADEFVKTIKRRRVFSAGRGGIADISKLANEFSKDLVLRPKFDLSTLRRQTSTDIEVPVKPSIWVWTRAIRELKAITAGVTGGGIDIPIMPDFERFQWWMRVWASYFSHRPMEIPAKPDFDPKDFDRGIRELGARRILELEARPKVDKKLALSLREYLRGLFGKLKTKIQPYLDRAAAALAKTELEIWFKRLKILTAEVRTVLNKKSVKGVQQGLAVLSGVRLFKDLISLEPFKDIDRQLPKIALMATLIGQASNFMLSLSSDALSLGRSLGAIVPAALALPGVFLAAGVSLYAIIKPLAQFNRRLPEMARGLSAMQDAMVSSFWRRAHDGMASLAGLLPALNRGFRIVGGSAGAFMGTLSQGLSIRLKASLLPFLNAVGIAFGSLTRAARPISRIIGNFVDLGSSYLPRLAAATEGVIKRFADFFDKNMKNGHAFDWVDRGISNLKNLGGVVAGVYRIMDGLSLAAEKAGGATLGSLAAGLDRIQRTVKSESFQSGLVNVFASARIAIEEMVRIAGPAVSRMFATMAAGADEILPRIGRVAGTLASMFARILGDPVVGLGLITFFDGLSGALRTLEPSVGNVAKGLGGVLRVLGKMLTSFAPIVEIALGAVAKHAEGMLVSVERIVEDLSRGVTNLLRALTPAIDALAPAVLAIAEGISKGIAVTLTSTGPALSTILQVVAAVLGVIGKLPPAFQLAIAAAGLLAVALGRLAVRFGPTILASKTLRTHLGAMGRTVQRTVRQYAETATWTGRMGDAFRKVAPHIGTMRSKMTGLVVGLGKFIGVAAGVVSAAGMISAGFKGAAAGPEEFGLAMDKLAKGDLSGFDRQFQNTKNLISGGAKDMKDALTQLSFEKYMHMDGLNKGLDESIGKMLGFRSATSEMRDVLSRIDSQLATMFQNDPTSATAAFDRIKETAIQAGWSVADLEAMFPEFKAAVESATNGGAGAFKTAVNGMVSDAQKLQDEVFGRMSRQERQIDVLGGKAKAKVAQQLAKARTQMLTELSKTAEGTDRVVLSNAAKLNTKIAEKAAELKKNAGKGASSKIATELDALISEYRSKFGDLPNLLDGAEGGSLSAAISKMVGNGITPEAQASVKASIVTPVNTAVAEAKAKVAEIKTVTQGFDVAGPIRAAFTLAEQQIGSNTATLVAAAKAGVASVASQTSGLANGLAAPIRQTAIAVFNGLAQSIGGYNKALTSKLAEGVKSAKTTADKVKGVTKFSLESQGAAVASSYVRGLRSKLSDVVAAAKAITKATKDNKGPISYDRVMLIPEGQAVVQGFVKGLLSEVGTVESTMQDITDIVAGTKFDAAIKQANRSANNAAVLGGLSVGTSQYITQVGDVTIDVSELEGIKTVDDLGRTLRRKRRQRGGS